MQPDEKMRAGDLPRHLAKRCRYLADGGGPILAAIEIDGIVTVQGWTRSYIFDPDEMIALRAPEAPE